MKIDVQPGSIKDQALQIICRQPGVNRTQLGHSMSCNGALLNIALDGMLRDEWIRKNADGGYELLVEIDVDPIPSKRSAGEQGGSAPGLNGAARAEPRAPRPAASERFGDSRCKFNVADVTTTTTPASAENTMSTESRLKQCPACLDFKRRHQDFDVGSQRCKQCVRENRPKAKAHERVQRASSPAPTKTDEFGRTDETTPNVFVIPSTGAILCETVAGLFVAKQQNNILRFNREQLVAFRDWATRELEQSGSAT